MCFALHLGRCSSLPPCLKDQPVPCPPEAEDADSHCSGATAPVSEPGRWHSLLGVASRLSQTALD